MPKNHLFGPKCIPLETNYYEAYNPSCWWHAAIDADQRITRKGIKNRDKEYESMYYLCDWLRRDQRTSTRNGIYGVKVVADSGKMGQRAANGLGLQKAGFPNFFIATNTAFCNYTICAETIVEWITDCIGYLRKKNYSRIAPTLQAEDAWIEHVNKGWPPNVPDQHKVMVLR